MAWDLARLLAATVIVALAAFGAGSVIERLFPDNFSRLEHFAFRLLGGYALLGTVLFVVGQIIYTPIVISLVLAAGILFGLRSLLNGYSSGGRFPGPRGIPLIPAILIAGVLLVTAIAGMADIVGDRDADGVAYHLLGPKVWLRDGVIRPVLDNSHTAFPALAEVMYGAFMVLGGPHGPGFSAVLTLAMFLLVVMAVARRCGVDIKGTYWAAAFVATMPAVYAGAHSGFVDVFYASLVLAAARIGFDTVQPREFAAFGLFCGFAMATKYTGLLAFAALLLIAGIFAWNSGTEQRRRILPRAGLAILIATIVAAPDHIRNWILLGTPIYPPPPLVSSIVKAKYLSPEAVRDFHAYIYQRGAGLGRGLGAFLSLPFNLTYHTSNFHGAGGIGLYALALGPFALIASRRNRFAVALAILTGVLTVAWFVTQQESRFLIHVYAITAIFAVLGWNYVKSISPRYGRLLSSAAISLSLAYGVFMIGTARAADVASVFSGAAAEHRRQTYIPFLDSFRFLNKDASVTRVLILDPSVPPYYLDKPYVKIAGQWKEQPLAGIHDANDALRNLEMLHVSHVLDVRSEVSDFQVPDRRARLDLVFERIDQKIYRVREPINENCCTE